MCRWKRGTGYPDGGKARPNRAGRSRGVNLVYDQRRSGVVAIYGTVKDLVDSSTHSVVLSPVKSFRRQHRAVARLIVNRCSAGDRRTKGRDWPGYPAIVACAVAW